MNDEKNYMKAATTLFDRYYKNDDEAISLLLGSAQRIVKDKAFVQTTRQWALHALSLKDNSLNNLSLALVYAKEKNREMAVKYVDASLAVSKRDNDGYAGRIEMFKKDILDGKW
jgi:lipoate-protein ligase A